MIILLQTGPRMEMTSRKTFAVLIKMQLKHAVHYQEFYHL